MNEISENREVAIKISGVKKKYKLGQIGGGTLQADIQSWWARIRGKEDPNSIIGQEQRLIGQSFMALNGIDLTVYKGEALGIIGGNGAGKSTLLKLLSRVTAPTEGELDIYGRIASMLEVGTGFNGEMTGRENVYMNGAILGMTKAEIDAKMEQIIEFSEVRDFIDTPVKRYSSGMYVKLAFSVAAHLDSEIMIMDEVLAVGDMKFQQKCLNKMRDAAKKEGRTVLYVSHNMNTIRQLCDRCVVLDKGKVIFEGNVEKAINIYMGAENTDELPVSYDFSNVERNYEFGKQVFIKNFTFLNRDNAVYEIGEKVDFEVCFDSSVSIAGAQLLLQIKDNDYVKIGMALSKPFDIVIAVGQKIRFSISTKYFSDDIYSFNIEIIKRDSEGNYYSYDNPGSRMAVQMLNQYAHGILWNKNYWGSVMFPEIEIIQVDVRECNKFEN